MKIEALRIKNFKAFKSVEMLDLPAFCVIVGAHGTGKKQGQSKYCSPDNLPNAAQELQKLTEKKYQKVSGSRVIAPFLNVDGFNKSSSFNVLLDGIRKPRLKLYAFCDVCT